MKVVTIEVDIVNQQKKKEKKNEVELQSKDEFILNSVYQ